MQTVVRAVILAAGASARMGRPKATLPLSHRADTFLSRIARALAAAGLPEIVVVTGAVEDEVRRAAGRFDRRLRFVHNPRWQEGQLTSLLAGLDDDSTPVLEAVLVTLVDVPLVTAETIAMVVHAWRHSGAPLVRPARGATHGHPVLFDRSLFDELRAADPATGAKAVVRAHAHEILEVPVDDPGAFVDVDTREEYAAILAELDPPSGPLQD
jgi:molybdenum cofactor cytidylyltransferase